MTQKLTTAQSRELRLIAVLTNEIAWRGHRYTRLPHARRRWPVQRRLESFGLIERMRVNMGPSTHNHYWELTDAGRALVATLPALGSLPEAVTRIGPFPWQCHKAPPVVSAP